MKKLIIVITLLVLLKCSVYAREYSQSIVIDDNLVELRFENIKVEDVTFTDSNEIIIDYNRKDVITKQEDHVLILISPKKEAKVSLHLPDKIKYHVKLEEGNLYFNSEGVSIFLNDGTKIIMNGKQIEVYEYNAEIILYEDGTFIMNSEDEGKVEITSDGIFIKKIDGAESELTNFWGKVISAISGLTIRSVMNIAGENPEEVAVSSLNEFAWKKKIEDVMLKVEEKVSENQVDKVIVSVRDLTSNINGNRYNRIVEKNYPESEVKEISIDNFNGKIEIESGNYDQIEVKVTISSEKEKYLDNVDIKFEPGNHLKVLSKALKRDSYCSINYYVTLPEGIEVKKLISSNGSIILFNTEGKAVLNTSNGSIEIEDHHGSLTVHTSNGSIEIDNVSGYADLLTSNGRIVAEEVKGWIKAVTSNSNISLEDCDEIKKVWTSNGSIYINISQLSEFLNVNTSNGDIKVELSSDLNCDLKATTSNGRIRLHDIEFKIEKQSKEKLVAQYNGGGKLLELETTNADIDIYQE